MKRLRSIIACIWLMQNWRRLSPETRLLIQADMYRILKEKRGNEETGSGLDNDIAFQVVGVNPGVWFKSTHPDSEV